MGVMFTKLTDTTKATIFAVLVLCLAVGAALLSAEVPRVAPASPSAPATPV